MLSSTASALLRLGGWSYLPDFATRKLLALYHHLLRSHGITVPQPGTPHWQKHYRMAFALSVLTFLSYNLVEAARDTPPNFFQILGVTPQVDDIALKTAYRTFAKRYHPDRAGPASESLFIEVRDAYDALKNPVKRFAYERFGPDSLKWRDCSTPREFLQRGLSQASGFYIGSGVILVGMSAVMKPSPVAFWRYILLLGLFASELCLTAGYQSAGIFGYIFSNRVAFQHILFLHHLFVFLSIALSRVVPVLFPDLPSIRPEDSRTYAPFLEHLNTLAKAADGEVSRLLHLELHSMSSDPDTATAIFGDIKPCQPSITVLDTLTREMEDIVVEQQARAEPPLRALWDVAVRRKMENERERMAHLSSADNGPASREGRPETVKADENEGHKSKLRALITTMPAMSTSPEVRYIKLSPEIQATEHNDSTGLPSPRSSHSSSTISSAPILRTGESSFIGTHHRSRRKSDES